jgi:DNA/RNA-binding domain of Phe-tRNA-synthetase-like protein
VLRGRSLFKINTFVDAYNLASMKTALPIASFDEYVLNGGLYMREGEPGEEFLGIAMNKPITLRGGEAVIEDSEKLVAIYPYRDADASKVTLDTKDVKMLMCGAPGIEPETLTKAGILSGKILTRFCGGKVTS